MRLTSPTLAVAASACFVVTSAGITWGDQTKVLWDRTESAYQPVSGTPNPKVLTALITNETLGVRAIAIQEKGDAPCRITVHTIGLPGSTARPDRATANTYQPGSVCDGNEQEARVKDNEVITAIQVCTNGKKTEQSRIKGLRVWGATVSSTGTLSISGTGRGDDLERLNCSDWSTRSSCPPGQIVTGLRGHATGVSFSGIAIQCSPVKTTKR